MARNVISQQAAIRICGLTAFIAALFPILFFIRASGYWEGRLFFTLFDDAMISMTYARTFSETGELVWFPGAERVQGYTNLLWTLYIALLHSLGLTGAQASAAVSLTGLVCILGSSLLCVRLVSNVIPDEENQRLWGFLIAAIVPLLYPLVFWSLRGMEVGLLCFLALSTLALSLAYEGRKERASGTLVFAATIMTSVVGVLVRLDFAALVFVIAALQFALSENKRGLLLFTSAHIGAIILAAICVLSFQFLYYGDFVPNTYRLKVEGYAAIDRIIAGFVAIKNVAAIVFLVAASAWMALKDRQRPVNKLILLASGVFLTASAYSIWVGGDAWEWSRMANRYVSIALPFAVISIMLGAYQCRFQSENLGSRTKIKMFLVFACLIYATVFLPSLKLKGFVVALALMGLIAYFCRQLYNAHGSQRYRFRHHAMTGALLLTFVNGWSGVNWLLYDGMHINDDFHMSRRGAYLKEVTTEKAFIATVWAGAPAYFSERRMIDLLGKSDREIASRNPIGKIHPGHNKWDYAYSIGLLRPDVVFQLWSHTNSDIRRLHEWGYVEKCVSNERMGYFLLRSEAIRWPLLTDCPR